MTTEKPEGPKMANPNDDRTVERDLTLSMLDQLNRENERLRKLLRRVEEDYMDAAAGRTDMHCAWINDVRKELSGETAKKASKEKCRHCGGSGAICGTPCVCQTVDPAEVIKDALASLEMAHGKLRELIGGTGQ